MQSMREQTRLHPTGEQVKVFLPKPVSMAGESGCGSVYRTRLYRPIYMDYVYGGGRREIERGRMTARRNHGGRDKSLNILPRQRNTRRLPYPERITQP